MTSLTSSLPSVRLSLAFEPREAESDYRMDLETLNGLTKYPSIATLHAMGEKGRLSEALSAPLPSEPLFVTEKIDGSNARIILSPDGDFVIGSREELLHAKGDRVWNPAQGIVEAVRPVAELVLAGWRREVSAWGAIFGEVYGHNKGRNARNYATLASGFRVFDIIQFDQAALDAALSLSRESLATWRDEGRQPFVPEGRLRELCGVLELSPVPTLECAPPPTGIAETAAWLKGVSSRTRAALDTEPGESEGVVIRSRSRSFIAKARHEDYQRTLKQK